MPEQKRLSLAGIGCGSRTRTYMKLAMDKKTATASPPRRTP